MRDKAMSVWKILVPLLAVLVWAGCRLLHFDACPTGMVEIEDYCIDRWEAHLVDKSPFQVPQSGEAATDRDVVPQGYISADVAEAACRQAGKRLCTSTEWLRACQGPEGTTFPYGNTYDENACNEGREVHPIVELFGNDADWSAAQMNDPRVNQLPNSLDPTGSNPECVTSEGVFDMHGNLHEWVADPEGTFRGGFYVDARINGRGCLYRTTAHSRSYHDYSTGFRCCADL
jgi:formylglycine-generating enzyme required for sulfatase activity